MRHALKPFLLFLLSIFFLAIYFFFPSFPSPPASLEEAKRLEARVLTLIRARRYAEALPLAKRALKTREKVLGAEHPKFVLFLNRLAFIYTTQKNLKEAGVLRARSKAIQKRLAAQRRAIQKRAREAKRLAWEKKRDARDLYADGDRLQKAGKHAEVIPLFVRALALFEKELGPAHVGVGTVLQSLGNSHLSLNQYEKAEPYLRKVLGIFEKGLGPSHPAVDRTLARLAALYEKNGKKKEATAIRARARAIRKEVERNIAK
ncbi:MAG: tetratricopeptide repeat-containing protein [Nitrospinota bacterium]